MMRREKIQLWTLLLLGFCYFGCTATKKVQTLTSKDVATMVEDHEFHFIAEKMDPLRAPEKILNSYYDLLVVKDTLNSFLPYYGRAFVAPIDPTQGGLRFSSYDFTYDYTMKDKSWNVTIVPKDVTRVIKLYFTIFNNGNTTLQVTSVNLDPISFQGHLEKVE